jgi:two-component system, NarL family, sensor histidine kinase EvgS
MHRPHPLTDSTGWRAALVGAWMLLLALVLPLHAAPAALPATPVVEAAPQAGDVITVGVLGHFPPFYRWDTNAGAPTGLDAELLAEISRTTGLVFRWRRYDSFPALLAGLQAGEVRMTTATALTADRARQLRFTRPYASVQQAFFGPSAITSVPATPDLSGRRLAVVMGYASESIAAERFPAAARPSYPSIEAALDAVQRGEVDFVLEALPALEALARERVAAGLAVLRTYGFPEGHLRLATRGSDEALVRQLDAAIEQAQAQVLPALRQRWLPPAPTPSVPAAAPLDVAPLRVAFLPGDRPFTLVRGDGQADGIGIRMMQRVAERAGVPLAGFEPMTLSAGLEALREGRIDLMLGLTDIAERRDRITFVGPYRANPLVVISRKQYSVWGLHQLAGQRLAMVKGFFGLPYVRSTWPTVQIVECETFDECLQLLEDGTVNAALYGLQGAYERLGPRAGSTLQITGTVPGLYDEHNLGLTAARASLAPRLRDALNVALHDDMPGIEATWSAEEQTAARSGQLLRRVLLTAAIGLPMLGLLWWLHWRRLRREIGRTEAARQESEHYLAFMAHEVRNALQSVGGAVVLLRGSGEPAGPGGAVARAEAQQPLLEALGRSTRSTLGLLDGLLDRHRLHAGRLALELRPESLERVLRAVVDEVEPMARAKGLVLRMEPQTALSGWWMLDALRLQQIVRNLLVNAIKFSPQGEVSVRASLRPATEGLSARRVCVEVVDQGPGLPEALRGRVFDGHHSSGGDRPGSGLGLTLCRDLARALGGSLVIAGPAGAGTTATLEFPVEPAAAAGPGASPRAQRLLVVEDSVVYALLLRQAFENQGVQVTVAENLAAAREALTASMAGLGDTLPAFDLVLADTHLDDGTADTLLAFMHGQVRPGARLPPVVCMSAQFDEPQRQRLREAGAAALLTKDGDVASFATRVLAIPAT